MALTAPPTVNTLGFRSDFAEWLSDVRDEINDKAATTHVHAEATGILLSACLNEAALGTGSTDGEWKICTSNGNQYSWDDGNSKWRVHAGNRYTTATLPSSGTYTIPEGTIAYDATTGWLKLYKSSSWTAVSNNAIVDTEANLGSGTSEGEIRYVLNGNRYSWDDSNSKWRILDGNSYATVDLPTAAVYTIPTSVVAIDTTVSSQKYWDGDSWELSLTYINEIHVPGSFLSLRQDANVGFVATDEYATYDVSKEYAELPGDATKDYQFSLYLPGWDQTTFKVKFRWTGTTGCSVSDGVVFAVKAKFGGNDYAIDSSWGSWVEVTDAITAADGDDYQISPASASVTPGGNTSSWLDIWIIRDYADASDTMTEDARLFDVIIQYPLDSGGISAW